MKWRLWVPVGVYIAVIFTLSSIPDLKPPITMNNGDKLAHFMEYGIFGLLLYRAVRRTWAEQKTVFAIVVTVLIGFGVAVLDELYQGTVPGRQKSANDAVADLIGVTLAALLGQLIAHLWMQKRREANAET